MISIQNLSIKIQVNVIEARARSPRAAAPPPELSGVMPPPGRHGERSTIAAPSWPPVAVFAA
jgi:hypothetical protein